MPACPTSRSATRRSARGSIRAASRSTPGAATSMPGSTMTACYADLSAFHDRHYAAFSRLMRCTLRRRAAVFRRWQHRPAAYRRAAPLRGRVARFPQLGAQALAARRGAVPRHQRARAGFRRVAVVGRAARPVRAFRVPAQPRPGCAGLWHSEARASVLRPVPPSPMCSAVRARFALLGERWEQDYLRIPAERREDRRFARRTADIAAAGRSHAAHEDAQGPHRSTSAGRVEKQAALFEQEKEMLLTRTAGLAIRRGEPAQRSEPRACRRSRSRKASPRGARTSWRSREGELAWQMGQTAWTAEREAVRRSERRSMAREGENAWLQHADSAMLQGEREVILQSTAWRLMTTLMSHTARGAPDAEPGCRVGALRRGLGGGSGGAAPPPDADLPNARDRPGRVSPTCHLCRGPRRPSAPEVGAVPHSRRALASPAPKPTAVPRPVVPVRARPDSGSCSSLASRIRRATTTACCAPCMPPRGARLAGRGDDHRGRHERAAGRARTWW